MEDKRPGTAVVARHGRNLFGGQPELFDDATVADDHQQQRQDEHDGQLVNSYDEARVGREALTLSQIAFGVHAVVDGHGRFIVVVDVRDALL